MRQRLLLVFAILGILLGTALPSQAIINGQPDNGAHPMVGELLFYLPDGADPRFTDPGAWASCTGTLADPDTVVTAGHCTYGLGRGGTSTVAGGGSGSGGTDVWFTTSESPGIAGILPSAADYAPDDNAGRYAAAVAALDASADWHRATAIPHPGYVDLSKTKNWTGAFHDLGVLQLHDHLSEPTYGRLPALGVLDTLARSKPPASFSMVGYGLEQSGPQTEVGGDSRRTASVALASLNGVFGLDKGEAATFSSNNGQPNTGGACFGDSGGPIFQGKTTVVTAVISFVASDGGTCSGVTGGYRLDQPDDLTFLAPYVN